MGRQYPVIHQKSPESLVSQSQKDRQHPAVHRMSSLITDKTMADVFLASHATSNHQLPVTECSDTLTPMDTATQSNLPSISPSDTLSELRVENMVSRK